MSEIKNEQVASRLEFARKVVVEAGELTLRYFQSEIAVDRKGDGSPVTIADRGAEELLRKLIAERFPEDGVVGEEFGRSPGTSGYIWVLDPIDGTKSFIHGVPLYTNLIGVLHLDGGDIEESDPVLGVINAPATGEMIYAAVGGGAWLQKRGAEPTPARVSKVGAMSESLFLTTEVQTFGDGRPTDATDVYLALQERSRLSRTWGDAYGYLMVATGRAELMVDPELSLWDAAAVKPIIEEAGGEFFDWQGRATVHSREAIATNGLVSEEVLAVTRGR